MNPQPIFKTVQRTLLERVFSWPWNPWVATKQERDYAAEFAPQPHGHKLGTQRAGQTSRATGHAPPRPMPAPAAHVPRRHEPASRPTDDSDSWALIAAAKLASQQADRLFVARTEPEPIESGGGGQFAGGGASDSFEVNPPSPPPPADPPPAPPPADPPADPPPSTD